MLRHLSIACLAGALSLAPTVLSAQTSLSIAGGASAPVQSLGDAAEIGYNAAIGLNFGAFMLPIGARLEGGYNSFTFKDGDGDFRVITGTANAVVGLSQLSSSPYLIGGVGIYNAKANLDLVGFDTESKNKAGINIGGGLRFPLGGLSTFFEARYHTTLGDDANTGNYQFIPITFGIMF